MLRDQNTAPVARVLGPRGESISFDDLPPPSTKRWVIRRKAIVVAAVQGGLISLDDACSRYSLSVEEFLSWQSALESHGLPGLRTTRIQLYRGAEDEAPGTAPEEPNTN